MIHETGDDRKNEWEIASFIAEAWRLTPMQFAKFARIDMGLVAPDTMQVRGWLECKNRPQLKTINQFQRGVMLSADKFVAMREWAIAFAVPSWFAVRTADQNVYAAPVLSLLSPAVFWTGRTKQKRSDADIEPIVYVPVELFKHVGSSE